MPEDFLHLSPSRKHESIPDFDTRIRCETHPLTEPEQGFGMAGGGYGVYTFCPSCQRILSKSEEME